MKKILLIFFLFLSFHSGYCQEDYETYYLLGLVSEDSQKFNEALMYYNKTITLDPKYADAYVERGNVESALGQHSKAMLDYDKAVKLNPKLPTAYKNRGNEKYVLGEKMEAILDFKKAVELDPQYAKAYSDLASAEGDAQQYQIALIHFNKAIQLNDTLATAYYGRSLLKDYLYKDYTGEINDLDMAIKYNLKNKFVYYNRGVANFNLKRFEEAKIDYTNAINIDNHFASAFYNRGVTRLKLGEKAGACFDLNDAYKYGLKIAGDLLKSYCN